MAQQRGGPFGVAGLDRVHDLQVLAARFGHARVLEEFGVLVELAQLILLLRRGEHETVAGKTGQHLMEGRIELEKFGRCLLIRRKVQKAPMGRPYALQRFAIYLERGLEEGGALDSEPKAITLGD